MGKDASSFNQFQGDQARKLANQHAAAPPPPAAAPLVPPVMSSEDLWIFVEDSQETVRARGNTDWVDLRNLLRVVDALKAERDAALAPPIAEVASGGLTREQVNVLIDKVIDAGCSCDVMHGYRCGIHEPTMQLRNALATHPGKPETPRECPACGALLTDSLRCEHWPLSPPTPSAEGLREPEE